MADATSLYISPAGNIMRRSNGTIIGCPSDGSNYSTVCPDTCTYCTACNTNGPRTVVISGVTLGCTFNLYPGTGTYTVIGVSTTLPSTFYVPKYNGIAGACIWCIDDPDWTLTYRQRFIGGTCCPWRPLTPWPCDSVPATEFTIPLRVVVMKAGVYWRLYITSIPSGGTPIDQGDFRYFFTSGGTYENSGCVDLNVSIANNNPSTDFCRIVGSGGSATIL